MKLRHTALSGLNLFVLATLIACSPCAHASDEAAPNAAHDAWLTDFDAAKVTAAKEGKDILVDFSGSDWCGWCIRLDKEVFSHAEFTDAAGKDFVLVMLDFPRKPENLAKISEDQQKRNNALKDELGVRGFPSVYLTGADGDVYAQTGYQAGGPEKYLEHIQAFKSKKNKRAALIKTLNETSPDGGARARLLHEIIESTGPERVKAQHQDDMKAIIEIDSDNALGLRSVYQLVLRKYDAQEKMESKDFDGAIEIYENIIAELKPEGQALQDIWLEAGAPHFYLKDNEGLRRCLDSALEAAPEGERVEHIKGMMKRFFPEDVMPVLPDASDVLDSAEDPGSV